MILCQQKAFHFPDDSETSKANINILVDIKVGQISAEIICFIGKEVNMLKHPLSQSSPI